MAHGACPCPSPGRQDAVVDDEVDTRAGGQGGELLEELDRREEEMTRSVVPLTLERDQDEARRVRRIEAFLHPLENATAVADLKPAPTELKNPALRWKAAAIGSVVMTAPTGWPSPGRSAS